MVDILIAVAAKVSEYLVAPIGRQLGYLFCYRRHSDELRNKVETLGTARGDVQISVDEATRRGDQIRPVVQDWLDRVDRVTGEAAELMMKSDENNNKMMSCFNLKSRYLLGRQAYKKALVIVDIQTARNFPDGISHRPPPRTVTFREYESYESRASTLNQIMDALKDDKTKMIGVWGMGGVGKTTLVKQVAEQAKQQGISTNFNTQVYVNVSWTREADKFQQGISDIQQKIAGMLGLKFENEATKAAELAQRLKNEKILIVLDDIWKEVNLEDVGINPSCKDCKIVLASRDGDLLRRDMGAQICFPIQHLQQEEAWDLFKKTAGDCVEGNELRPTAEEVVKECQGLPVAIVTIAKALKDEMSVAVWKNALKELKSCAPINIRGVEEKVYGCLKWSYNNLNGDDVKSLFLLCGSLSYGDISMVHLLRCAMGLDSFNNMESLEEARNKLVTLVRTLKASSLLLDGEEDYSDYFERGSSRLLFMDGDDNKSVRMHDVVRDVARSIASKEPHRFKVIENIPFDPDWSETGDSKFISLNCQAVHELPHALVRPKLQFFLLQNYNPSLNITDTFFEGMNQLKVLDLSKMDFTALPSSLQSLANLRTLCLDWCKKLRHIAGIGELKKLQVLSMVGSNIQQLPQEMAQLTNLRLLDLNDCKALEVIPPNIVSKLSRLECLFMKSSFSGWAAEEVSGGESNACLSELNHLDHLRTIAVEIPDVELVPKEDKFFQNLTSFAIFIGNFHSWEKIYERSKTLRLKGGDGSLLLRNEMCKLLEKTEELQLKAVMEEKGKGNVCIPYDDGVLFRKKVLFLNLEEVTLSDLPQLKKIWDHNLSPHSFSNLQILKVEDCPCLLNLIPGHLMRSFNNLKEMVVRKCKVLEHIIDLQECDTNVDQLLPELETLWLEELVGLKGIVHKNGDNDNTRGCFSPLIDVSFRNIKTLYISYCGKQIEDQENADIPIEDGVLFGEKVSFPNLEELTLYTLPKLKKIWVHNLSLDSFSNLRILEVRQCSCLLDLIPGHLMWSFYNLKEITVHNCDRLEHVFDFQGCDTNDEILPKLETLKLQFLAGLKGIVRNNENNDSMRGCFSPLRLLSFRSLKTLSIDSCGKQVEDQENVDIPIEDGVLFGEKVSFPNLEELNLSGLSMLKMIWHPQHEFSNELQILRVSTCSRLVNLIPSHLLKRFQNLKEIVVRDCQALNYVFDHEGILPKIEILKLEKLPKLRLILCNGDKNDNTRDLLSISQFKALVHVKELYIINCGKPLDEKGSFSSNLEVLVLGSFSKLKEINFENPRKLKTLKLEKLPKLSSIILNENGNASKRCLLSPTTFKNFHDLKVLSIVDCGAEDTRDVYTATKKVVPLFDGGVCNYEAFESRAPIFDKIMDALRDDDINCIGVVGIGGVGKTTLVKQVAHQAILQHHLFTKQVFINVSWTRHSDKLPEEVISDIQEKIARKLGWECEHWFWYVSKREVEMKKRLKEEKMLIILDDIWKEINLEEIGIPSCKDNDDDVNECKIVLICREGDGDGEQLCKDIGAQTCFRVGTLRAEEAWTLFQKTAISGDCDHSVVMEENNPKVRSIAQQVVEECCEGLPIAVVAIAKALKDETMPAVWESALGQLIKNCAAAGGNKVYSCLDWSYNTHLKGDHDLKSLLLLCGSLRYGDISMDHLLQYAIGLDLFGPIHSLDQARNRLLELVEILKASSWLIDHRPDQDKHKFVRMHDVVYDVVREIASKDPQGPFVLLKEDVVGLLEEWLKSDESKSCTFLSLHCKDVPHQLPQRLVCPELQCFLLCNNNNDPSLNIPIPNTFFQGMKKLQVLDLSGMRFTTLPSSLDSLANLQTLRLDWCYKLVDIAGIGELKKLLVLSLVGSPIEQLPMKWSN